VALARVAAEAAATEVEVPGGWDGPVAPPRARAVPGPGPALGADGGPP